MTAKTKTHSFTITLTFDRATSASVALREARDTIHGIEYCTQLEDDEPGQFRVRSIRTAPRRAKKR